MVWPFKRKRGVSDAQHKLATERYEVQQQLMDKMGFVRGDDGQNWLRLHEILFDHEGRIRSIELAKALEAAKK